MRISDWSSDVCSSDLARGDRGVVNLRRGPARDRRDARGGEGGERGVLALVERPGERGQFLDLLHREGQPLSDLRVEAGFERHVDGDMEKRAGGGRSEEHTSELQSLMRISYAVV